jgi:hypothetical protein
MAESAAFAHVCAALESETTFSRIEARGTVRLALKSAGLDAKNITVEQMKVILERILPGELESRGVPDPEGVCESLIHGLRQVAPSTSGDTPEDVFSRLGGS